MKTNLTFADIKFTFDNDYVPTWTGRLKVGSHTLSVMQSEMHFCEPSEGTFEIAWINNASGQLEYAFPYYVEGEKFFGQVKEHCSIEDINKEIANLSFLPL